MEDLLNKQVLFINDGYRAKNSELGTRGLPFVRAGNINNGFNFSGVDRYPEENLEKVGSKVSQPGDVLFTSKGTVGRFGFVDERTPRFVYSPQLCFWRSNDRSFLEPKFLYYWMHGSEFRHQCVRVQGQTDMADYVSLRDQRKFRISLPPLAEQKAIAHILGTLDDKIELNRRMNETLEAMARALFKSWFVDFDPVRVKAEAKASGTSPNEALAKLGIPPNLAPLFPDEFEESALGLVPKGWGVKALSDVIQINPFYPLKKGAFATYLDMKNMPTSSFRALEWWKREFGSGSRFMNGDSLLARITPCLENGKTAFVDFLDEDEVGWGSTEYIVLRAGDGLPVHYPYLLARSESFRTHCIANMTGSSGRQRVPTSCLEQLPVVVPIKRISQSFHDAVAPLFALAKGRDEESKSLSQTRDSLLPKLLSGEVRVGEAEAKAAEMV